MNNPKEIIGNLFGWTVVAIFTIAFVLHFMNLLTTPVHAAFWDSPASLMEKAEKKRNQAEELVFKAMRSHCKTVGKRINKCYSGNQEECKTLIDVSEPFFLNEYGADHPFMCSLTKEDFLEHGL
jgi:hypothetical protein